MFLKYARANFPLEELHVCNSSNLIFFTPENSNNIYILKKYSVYAPNIRILQIIISDKSVIKQTFHEFSSIKLNIWTPTLQKHSNLEFDTRLILRNSLHTRNSAPYWTENRMNIFEKICSCILRLSMNVEHYFIIYCLNVVDITFLYSSSFLCRFVFTTYMKLRVIKVTLLYM